MKKYTRTDQQAEPLTREQSERLLDELRVARAESELSRDSEDSLDSDSQ